MRKILLSICLVGLLGLQLVAQAAPKKDLWPRWQVNDPLATKTINHKYWGDFLHKYLHRNAAGINLVAYQKVTPADKQQLKSYLQQQQAIKIDQYNRNVQAAYWIDLYNAETVYLVLQHYPVKSILKIDISPGFFSRGPWGKKLITVEGEKLSLNDIEHRILRPIWNDPRIHYALNCASISCPNLQDVPFTGNNLNFLLNKGARSYINSPRGVLLRGNELVLSDIYEWYRADFGNSDVDVINHLRLYAKPQLAKALAKVQRIADYHYDWALNQATAQNQ